MRRSIGLALFLVVAAIGFVWLWRGLESPPAPAPADVTTASEPTSTAPHAVDESLEVADEAVHHAVDVRAVAAADRVDEKRTESFALDDVRWIEGHVRFPPGTPADEVLEVWALSPDIAPPRASLSDPSDVYPLVVAARTNDSGKPWAVRDVAPDGAFRVPFPKGNNARIALIGRYLYLSQPAFTEADATPAPLDLEPLLGGWVVGRCVAPAGQESAVVGANAEMQGFKLDARRNQRGMGFLNRTATVGSDLSFEHRAIPTDMRTSILVDAKTLAVATQDVKIEAGQRIDVTIELEPGARVRGVVKDDHGAPIADAAVQADEQRFNMFGRSGRAQRMTESAADGTFELVGMSAGKTHIAAQHDGFVDGRSDEIELAVGQSKDGVTIELASGNRIAGHVAWPDATPARGATVSARAAAEPQARGPRRGRTRPNSMGDTKSTKADDNGDFTLSGLGDGPFSVQAGLNKPGTPNPLLPKAEANVSKGPLWTAALHDVAAGASGIAFVLREPSGLKGRVIDDTDAPVKAFTLTAVPSFDSSAPIVDRSAYTESFKRDDGTFVFAEPQDGKYRIQVEADGYVQSGDEPTVVIPQSEAEFLLRVVRTGSASGRVVDPGGRAIAGAEVSADTPGTKTPFNFGAKKVSSDSDAQGDFELAAVPSGTIELTASADGFAKSDPITVQIAPRQATQNLVITLRTGGRLTGEIYAAGGAPSAGRAIQMFSMDGGDMRSVTADAAGRFEADHLTPGNYQLVAEPGQKERQEMERRMNADDANAADFMSQMKMASATIKDGETTHVVMGAPPKAPVKVSGAVTRAGEVVTNRTVMAIREGGAMLDSMKIGKVDASGHYELTLDQPGPVVLLVGQNPDAGRGIEFYETIPEVAEYQLDLALPLGAIQGRVRGASDHHPIAGVNVQLLADGSSSGLGMMGGGPPSARTDDDGRFEFTDLQPGTFAVAAGGSMGRRFQSEDSAHGRSVRGGLRVEADKVLDGVELELSGPGKLTGRVLDSNGQPAGGATVYVRDAQGELLHRFSGCTSDASGRYTYDGIAAGKYTVCARTSTLASRESNAVNVRESDTSEVDVTLEPGTWLRISLEDIDKKTVRAQVSVKNDRDQEVSQMIAFEAIQSMLSEGISSTEKRVGPLPAGKYLVTATARDGKSVKKSISLKGQEERKVVLRID